jgi:hypothetical protein
MHAAIPVHPVFLDLIIVIISGENTNYEDLHNIDIVLQHCL